MTNWQQVVASAPEFAARVAEIFDSGTNKTLATLRADGSPRISGSESKFEAGEVTLGMMPKSRKLADVSRDPRAAIHSPTLEPPSPAEIEAGAIWIGDAKMSGRLIPMEAPADSPVDDAGYFRLDIDEVALTYVGTPADHLVIESWRPADGWRRRTRT